MGLEGQVLYCLYEVGPPCSVCRACCASGEDLAEAAAASCHRVLCPPVHSAPGLPQDDREKKWRIQAVGVAPGSFDSRKALPTPWRGLRDAELR